MIYISNTCDGSAYGLRILYSPERPVLETGGGIFHALPLLFEEPFLVINGDIWTDYPLVRLRTCQPALPHLELVDNSVQHLQDDFALRDGQVSEDTEARLTFSGIGVYRAALFAVCHGEPFLLALWLRRAMGEGAVSGKYYQGQWWEIGAPERLAQLGRQLSLAVCD